jgi:hypothetical protein
MTTIFVCLCGKYDESQNLENDFKDKNGPLNRQVLFLRFSIKFYDFIKNKIFILLKEQETSQLHTNI